MSECLKADHKTLPAATAAPGECGRDMREHWWMHAGDGVVRLAWKVLWSWRKRPSHRVSEVEPGERGTR